jgi:prepilin-type processing-associated H-X9-DG protein
VSSDVATQRLHPDRTAGVIAIIGILAAMLFPVFARARESARKIQCLSNVKNIAMAVQMYLTDYDAFWPSEHDPAAIAYFTDNHPGGKGHPGDDCGQITHADPFLRAPVILDEYIKNRDVWRCPSAKIMNGAGVIIPIGPDGTWLSSWMTHHDWEGSGNRYIGPCYAVWPPGWGGTITDSFTQHAMASNTATGGTDTEGAFLTGIGTNSDVKDMKTGSINDPARYVVVGDSGKHVEFWEAQGLAWPDTCTSNGCGVGLASSSGPCWDPCAAADWDNCATSRVCGLSSDAYRSFIMDTNYRKGFARHLGGSNLGFADGHAKWMAAEAINTGAEPFANPVLEGVCACWPGSPAGYSNWQSAVP